MRKKTCTQKVNLFEKVQIPGYQDALQKSSGFMEDFREPLQVIAENRQVPSGEKRKEAEAITKNEKLTFLVYHKEYEAFLAQIRELGVVHIVERQCGEMDDTCSDLMRSLYALQEYAHRVCTLAPWMKD